MNKIIICFILLLGIPFSSQAAVYECVDAAGHRVYTENQGKSCKLSRLGKAAVYSTSPVSSNVNATEMGRVDAHNAKESQSVFNSADWQAAQDELVQAQRNLEEGRKVRYGNERNYVRYQERIAKLENAVREAEQKLNAAKNN